MEKGQLTAKRTTTVLGVPRDPRAPRDKHPGRARARAREEGRKSCSLPHVTIRAFKLGKSKYSTVSSERATRCIQILLLKP